MVFSAAQLAFAREHGLSGDATESEGVMPELSSLQPVPLDLEADPLPPFEACKVFCDFEKPEIPRDLANKIAAVFRSLSKQPDTDAECFAMSKIDIALPEPSHASEVITTFAVWRRTCKMKSEAWYDKLFRLPPLDLELKGVEVDEEALLAAEKRLIPIDKLLDMDLVVDRQLSTQIAAAYRAIAQPPAEDQVSEWDPSKLELPPHFSPPLLPRELPDIPSSDALIFEENKDGMQVDLPLSTLNRWDGLPPTFQSPATLPPASSSPYFAPKVESPPTTPNDKLRVPLMPAMFPPSSSPSRIKAGSPLPPPTTPDLDMLKQVIKLEQPDPQDSNTPRFTVPKLKRPSSPPDDVKPLVPMSDADKLSKSLAWPAFYTEPVDTLEMAKSESPPAPPASPSVKSEPLFEPLSRSPSVKRLLREERASSVPIGSGLPAKPVASSSTPARASSFLASSPRPKQGSSPGTSNQAPLAAAPSRLSASARLNAFVALRRRSTAPAFDVLREEAPVSQFDDYHDTFLQAVTAADSSAIAPWSRRLRCVASFRLLQQPVLSALQPHFDMVEWTASLPPDGDFGPLRDYPDLTIDGTTCVSFPLTTKLDADSLLAAVKSFSQTWGYERQLVVVMGQQAVAHRQLDKLNGYKTQLDQLGVTIERADGPASAVWFVRRFMADVRQSALEMADIDDVWTPWHDEQRTWLAQESTEDAMDLETIAGFHFLAARAIGAVTGLQDLIDMRPYDRIRLLQGIVGLKRATAFNERVEANKRDMAMDVDGH